MRTDFGRNWRRRGSDWPGRSLASQPVTAPWFWRRRGQGRDAGGPTDLARLEAILFLATEPLPSRKLAQMASLADGTQARTFVRQLNQRYDRHGFAFRVEEVAQGFQLLTRPQFGAWLRRLHATPLEVRLSTPAMETLAVVAHRQPVLRSEVEAIRGVQSGEMLKQLMEQDLVRISGRSPELGRPFLYGTTKKFLQVFGLKNLDELPRADVLKRNVKQPTPGEGESNISESTNPTIEETDVRVELWDEPSQEDALEQVAVLTPPMPESPRAAADEDEDDDLAVDDDDDVADDDDEDDDDDDDADDDEEEFEDEDWEEVDDEDEEEDEWEDEEDDDWDEEDDDDWDDDDEEEEEEEDDTP